MIKKYSLLLLLICSSLAFGEEAWILGSWNMLDDFTEKPEAIIQFYEHKNIIEGKITEVFPDPEDEPVDVCKPCKGEDKNKPIIGLVVFKQLRMNARKELEGKVLDPDTGKIYSCKLTRLKDGRIELHVTVNFIVSQDRYLSAHN